GTIEQLDELAQNTAEWAGGENESQADATSSGTVDSSGEVKPVGATDGTKKSKPKPALSHADILLKLASSAELFHSPDQRCFARIEANGHRENHEIKSTGFRRWLISRFLQKRGRAPSSEALQNAIATLDAKA